MTTTKKKHIYIAWQEYNGGRGMYKYPSMGWQCTADEWHEQIARVQRDPENIVLIMYDCVGATYRDVADQLADQLGL